ncbi:hypothetical protein ACH4FX_01720 [Streptomyces sp. NPDC018019]|uniref:hypothetical protein n=1 Tax=Streptomyces sp. NPDC018019 TaxID=3365030 RepID=UPI0037874F14
MNLDLVRDWAVAAIAVRVFSADIRLLLRRLAAAQVLAGVSELTRSDAEARTRGRTDSRTRARIRTHPRTPAGSRVHRADDYGSPYGPQRDHDLQEGER